MNQADLIPLAEIVQWCQQSTVGKALPNALYVHRSAIAHLDPCLQAYERHAQSCLTPDYPYTLVKFHYDTPRISYLHYPNFERDPHPRLVASTQVILTTGALQYRDYADSANPPILHRKETFIAPDHPDAERFAHLTRQQETLGLFNDARQIGTLLNWEKRLRAQHLEIHNHALACTLTPTQPKTALPQIDRHRAAIKRNALSKPVRLALEAGLFSPGCRFLDYGCGHGTDVQFVGDRGYESIGYDPYYAPDTPLIPADVVNLGYIINVIEDPQERRQALATAWELARSVLIVAAQVLIQDRTRGLIAYEDGIITSRNTFQKYYDQTELKHYIDQVLAVDAIPIALGIYAVFRDERQAELFRRSRFRSRVKTPRIHATVKRFEDYQTLLQPVMDFMTERGRLPQREELEPQQWEAITSEFRTIKRAFQVITQATDAAAWDAIATQRRHDLLVYLALTHFSDRPKFRALPAPMQQDIKALFGTYQQACAAADVMLMSVGNLDIIQEQGRQSAIGQQRPNSLWVHISALEQLSPLLRLLEGCASRTIGRPDEATVVKFHFTQPKITYLTYPDFDRVPHPLLHTSMQIDLRDLQVKYRDCDRTDDPPILHQKEQLLTPDYPDYAKFKTLSDQERQWGLLDNVAAIYTRSAWERHLAEHCTALRGYRLVWRKDADPYQLKVLKAQIRRRQRASRDLTGETEGV
ncbi:DNA phosphorothioation-associated putative methyltransferase [Spirulina major]|uniref:DNA phosphorothioation-associated putative methyltransferase n=1 Tax=Spirulina major TaxID=270636 RepID=UPI000933ED0D|nr:DNA phosphorothioation-associated putative methyltransferase [Spirulina major]